MVAECKAHRVALGVMFQSRTKNVYRKARQMVESGELGDVFQPLEIASDNVILSALHSQNGKFYARLYEHTGAAGAAAITTPRRQAQLSDADPLGHVSNRVTSPVAFQPWQFRTLRIDPGA